MPRAPGRPRNGASMKAKTSASARVNPIRTSKRAAANMPANTPASRPANTPANTPAGASSKATLGPSASKRPRASHAIATVADTAALIADVTAAVLKRLQPAEVDVVVSVPETPQVAVERLAVRPPAVGPPAAETSAAEAETSAAEAWDGALRQTMSGLLQGDVQQHTTPQPVHMINSPLGATVPDRVKSKIWADEYVEFAELVHRQSQRPATLALSTGNEGYPTIAISPATRLRQIQNIDQWTTALLTFGSIYSQRNPSRGAGLFKYCEIVRDIAQTGPQNAWRQYDEQFRLHRQGDPDNYPWDQPRWDIFFRCMYAKSEQTNSIRTVAGPSTYQNLAKRPFRAGYCWSFQKGQCKNRQCRFQHACSKCNNPHPANQCRKSVGAHPNKR